jgi:hypothetical protein
MSSLLCHGRSIVQCETLVVVVAFNVDTAVVLSNESWYTKSAAAVANSFSWFHHPFLN